MREPNPNFSELTDVGEPRSPFVSQFGKWVRVAAQATGAGFGWRMSDPR